MAQLAEPIRRRWHGSGQPCSKATKNRLHLDLPAEDADAEVARLTALGATVADLQPNESLVVLADPEGNELCIRSS